MIGGFLFMGLCCLGITVSVLFQVLKKLKNRVLQNFVLIVIQVCKLLWLHMADEPWIISFVNITKKNVFLIYVIISVALILLHFSDDLQ